MKKYLALFMVIAMLITMVSCDMDTDFDSHVADDAPEGTTAADSSVSSDTGKVAVETDVIEDENLSYVLVYNPKIYDENAVYDESVLSTGDFGSQIEVDGNRGSGLEDDLPYATVSQDDINAGIPWDKINLDGSKGDTLGVDYEVGDEKEFYCYSSYDLNTRIKEEFECVYSGESCHVWSDGSMDEDMLEEYGEEFDENIYDEVVETFGEARFVGDSGKINLLFYPMPQNIGGCFCMLDLFAESEVSESEITAYGVNTNHAILHINSDFASDSRYNTYMCGTMAHEFQHLVCGTNYFYTVNETLCRVWLNEAMSGYIEEDLYPGSKEEAGHYTSFNYSGLIRAGQSMYNFGTDYNDIGVYGSVYYFSEYLTELAGDDVFSGIHEYWRDSYSSTLCESEALYESVSDSLKSSINNSIAYPDNVDFDSDYDEWMSKLTLDFYLSMLDPDSDIDAFENIDKSSILYDELDGASIEGGGRVILSVKDGKFTIPYDADEGLIYVGLDKDFEVITDFIYN